MIIDFLNLNIQFASIETIILAHKDFIVARADKMIKLELELAKNEGATSELIDRITSARNHAYACQAVAFPYIKALANYLLTDDEVIEVSTPSTSAGKLISGCVIVRNGERFPLSTNIIVAGGYNIQCEHLRYIVDTKLKAHNAKPYMTWLEKHQEVLEYINSLEIRIADKESYLELLNDPNRTVDQLFNHKGGDWYGEGQHRLTTPLDYSGGKIDHTQSICYREAVKFVRPANFDVDMKPRKAAKELSVEDYDIYEKLYQAKASTVYKIKSLTKDLDRAKTRLAKLEAGRKG